MKTGLLMNWLPVVKKRGLPEGRSLIVDVWSNRKPSTNASAVSDAPHSKCAGRFGDAGRVRYSTSVCGPSRYAEGPALAHVLEAGFRIVSGLLDHPEVE